MAANKAGERVGWVLTGVLLVAAGLPGLSVAAAQPASSLRPPNVLFIVVDDLNHWVGHLHRHPQAWTPNIDRLASRGVSFTNAHAAAPACRPSREAVLGGKRPWTTGLYTNDDLPTQRTPNVGLGGRFRAAGYIVAGAGKVYHDGRFPETEWDAQPRSADPAPHGRGVGKNEGFHDPLVHDLQDEDLGDWHSVNWCIEQLESAGDRPVFLACGLRKPHLPFAVPHKYFARFPTETVQLPPYLANDLDDVPAAGIRMSEPEDDHARILSAGRWKEAVRSYLAAVAYTDMNVGRLLDALDKSGQRDRTIVVLWGDNGWHLGEKQHWRKFTLWEEATRVPLVWVVPGLTPSGAVSARPVDLMSIQPTLLELAGLPRPPGLEGSSLLSLLRDPGSEWVQPALTTHGPGNHAVRSERWRYIRYADGSRELYDHDVDPYEWRNLAGDSEYDNVITSHEGWLPEVEAEPTGEPAAALRTLAWVTVALLLLGGLLAWRRGRRTRRSE